MVTPLQFIGENAKSSLNRFIAGRFEFFFVTVYGCKECWSAYLAFVLHGKHTIFSVVAVHASALQEIHL